MPSGDSAAFCPILDGIDNGRAARIANELLGALCAPVTRQQLFEYEIRFVSAQEPRRRSAIRAAVSGGQVVVIRQ
jgi:hypothetical protein